MALTRRQREILDFIESFIQTSGYSPSFEEIAEFFGYRSLATVHEHLSNLERKGYIRRHYNESRSVEPLEPARLRTTASSLPLLGRVAAGAPIEAIEDDETVAVPEDMLRGRGPHYVLRVRGDSMIEDQIRDGDLVVVDGRDTADNGEMVIALVQGESATVKRYFREDRGRIRLQPANQSHGPQIYDEGDVQVRGVVVGVLRRY
ncbi:MAG: transcriptional repressor LexA [Gemmatimonadetes bacterium]|uniref:LexA repressor n=1 Tax=Candidatus Kutchimonas denitrificans TaxID=3056748 RepID=A0AAE4ZBT7_9BACT|nr:transcriptional repressor LexA [Gemmatimonadota bacterium]NIR74605.1 transcriptional repressor LexA [Candidatus Kutchimonas denitrificans]NIS02795.1 transcriptional repressor LexA [Gemmatimonadota bacterium]NIT68956.1 transcriptional repressor LexA [Gemmatimonadota bacterium]NIU52261.1 transcriptional repressor LexA [Gemmatimonadota bacterium]